MSRRPCSEVTRSTMRATASGSRTLVSTALTRAPRAQLGGRRLEVLRVPAGDGHGGAGSGQARGDAQPDARPATGDERNPAGEHVGPEDRCFAGPGFTG